MNLFKRLLQPLLSSNQARGRRRQNRRAPSVRLGLECLEAREVPSASGLISATTGQAGQSVVYAIDRTGSVWEGGSGGRTFNGHPIGVRRVPGDTSTPLAANWVQRWGSPNSNDSKAFTQISATRNEQGQPVVYGTTRGGEIWEHNPSFGGDGWFRLAPF